MSSDAVEGATLGNTAESMSDLVGNTPLLGGILHPNLWLKLEGMQAGGSFLDRVVRELLAELELNATALVVDGGAFAASAACLSAAQGRTMEWLVRESSPRRTVALARTLGVRVDVVADDVFEATVEERRGAGRALLRPGSPKALRAAFASLRREVGMQSAEAWTGDWVVCGFGLDAEEVAAALECAPARVVLVDDVEGPSPLDPGVEATRTLLGHSCGILAGPGAARIVHEALRRVDTDRPVLAVLPDGGHRYLGWW